MPESPDRNSRPAECTRRVPTYSPGSSPRDHWERADSEVLDWDQVQWITRSEMTGSTRTKANVSRGGRTVQCKLSKLNRDQIQWINREHTDRDTEGGAMGKDGGKSKIDYAPPVSKDAAGRSSILAVAFTDKHVGSSSISFVQN